MAWPLFRRGRRRCMLAQLASRTSPSRFIRCSRNWRKIWGIYFKIDNAIRSAYTTAGTDEARAVGNARVGPYLYQREGGLVRIISVRGRETLRFVFIGPFPFGWSDLFFSGILSITESGDGSEDVFGRVRGWPSSEAETKRPTPLPRWTV